MSLNMLGWPLPRTLIVLVPVPNAALYEVGSLVATRISPATAPSTDGSYFTRMIAYWPGWIGSSAGEGCSSEKSVDDSGDVVTCTVMSVWPVLLMRTSTGCTVEPM